MDEELMINYDAPVSDVPMIQWFPGHMAKTRRLMQENLKYVDIVVEITDARIPQSSRNPEIDRIVGKKPRIILLNKSDSADREVTVQWLSYYKAKGIPALAVDCKNGAGLNQLLPTVYRTLDEVIAKRRAKGMTAKLSMMVVGVPNVGKSSFINRMAKSKRAKVEDRPGVTRGKQWVKIDENLDLLDMPGVLWPKFEDRLAGENLAFTGAVKDDILDLTMLAMRLLMVLQREYPNLLKARYKLEGDLVEISPYALLEQIGKKRGMLISGGEIDVDRAAIMLLDEFRSGKIGHITLERPPEENIHEQT